MKNFYRLIFSLFVLSILVLSGCTTYSADNNNNSTDVTFEEKSSDMGFIISFGSQGRGAYYTIDEVSYFKVWVSLGSNIVAERTATFSDTVKIGLTKEGLYTIAITAYNSANNPIADGSTQKQLYYDSGYQRVSIAITPYSKSIDIIVDVEWIQPEDTSDCYEATFIMNDGNGNSEVFYSKSISSDSESYYSCGRYSFFTDDIPVPTRPGYLFNGWCSDAECSNVVRTYTIFTDDIKHGYYMSDNTTYYAKWVETPNLIWSGSKFLRTKQIFDSSYFESFNNSGTFAVYFHNDSPDPKYDSISLSAGSTQIYTKNVHIEGSEYKSCSFTLTKENLDLVKANGLTVSSSSHYDFYLRGLAFAEGESYTETGYTITYNLNGGVNNSSNPSVFTADDSYIYLYQPTYAGYKFCGWYENEDCSGYSIDYIYGDERNANVELWAKWEETAFVPFPAEAVISSSGVYTATLVKEGFTDGWCGGDDIDYLKVVLAPRDVVAKMITGEITSESELFTDENMCYVYANNNVGNGKITIANLSTDTYLQPVGTNGTEYTGLAVRTDEDGNYVVLFDTTKINKDILLAKSNMESNDDVWENKGNIESDYIPMVLGCVTGDYSCYPFQMWCVGVA
ncbi:MAG: InlB B-repeat-containing protein, partial [Spirochaetota bacterium]|nr:InlB B-repeat-containing protein [Spirochaetota bacterium]